MGKKEELDSRCFWAMLADLHAAHHRTYTNVASYPGSHDEHIILTNTYELG